jgi:hypothetical protein
MQLLSFINQKLINIRGDLKMEEFFKNYQYTFSGIGAIASAGAVIISLCLTFRTEKAKIKAKLIIENKGDGSIYSADFIAVEVVNKSSFPVYIESDSFYLDAENINTCDFLYEDCSYHPIEDWGIREDDGNYYNSWSDIPHEIYSSITNLSLYNFISTVTEENLRAFIIFRLLSKLYYNDQEIILKSENDIRRLYSNERFIELFMDFLNKQAFASILPNIENEILDHSRPTEETNEWGYKKRTGTPLLNKEIRQLNMIYLKTITESADIAWIKLIEHIKTIMPENY